MLEAGRSGLSYTRQALQKRFSVSTGLYAASHGSHDTCKVYMHELVNSGLRWLGTTYMIDTIHFKLDEGGRWVHARA